MAKTIASQTEALSKEVEILVPAQDIAEIDGAKSKRHLGRVGLESFMKTVTLRRFELLKALRKSGPQSVRALSMLLKRDYKSVHGDVAKLLEIGLIDRTESGLIEVTWDKVSAELNLFAA